MTPGHAANLVAKSGNTAYVAERSWEYSYADYDDVPIMEFHGHEHHFLWHHVFTYCICTFYIKKYFYAKISIFIKPTNLNYLLA